MRQAEDKRPLLYPEPWLPATLTVPLPLLVQTKSKPKRVKALYNCVADNPDELTFSEGDVIIVDGEEDQEWWVSRGGAAGACTRETPGPGSWVRCFCQVSVQCLRHPLVSPG